MSDVYIPLKVTGRPHVMTDNRYVDRISGLNNQPVQSIHCNLCVLLYCSIHDINVLLSIIRMTLKINTGKYLTSNKTPINGTKKGLP